MKSFSLLCVISVLLTGFPCRMDGAETPAMITLKSTDGKTFEGTVLALEKGLVKVKRKDGKEFDIPLSRLTPETIAEIQKATAAKNVSEKKDSPSPKKPPIAKPTKPDDIEIKVIAKCGEKVSATFEQKGDVVTKAMVVKAPDDKTPHFDVEVSNSDGTTIAKSKHNFPKTLTMSCLARSKGSKNYFESNISPLFPGLPCYDSWGDVEEVVFFDFKFTDEKPPRN